MVNSVLKANREQFGSLFRPVPKFQKMMFNQRWNERRIRGGCMNRNQRETLFKHAPKGIRKLVTLQFTIHKRKDLLPIMTFKQISHMNFSMFSDISKLYGATFYLSRCLWTCNNHVVVWPDSTFKDLDLLPQIRSIGYKNVQNIFSSGGLFNYLRQQSVYK